MRLAALGLGIALAAMGAPASAQVGGPVNGPKPVLGGPATGPAAGASVGGPTTKRTVATGKPSTITPPTGTQGRAHDLAALPPTQKTGPNKPDRHCPLA